MTQGKHGFGKLEVDHFLKGLASLPKTLMYYYGNGKSLTQKAKVVTGFHMKVSV